MLKARNPEIGGSQQGFLCTFAKTDLPSGASCIHLPELTYRAGFPVYVCQNWRTEQGTPFIQHQGCISNAFLDVFQACPHRNGCNTKINREEMFPGMFIKHLKMLISIPNFEGVQKSWKQSKEITFLRFCNGDAGEHPSLLGNIPVCQEKV